MDKEAMTEGTRGTLTHDSLILCGPQLGQFTFTKASPHTHPGIVSGYRIAADESQKAGTGKRPQRPARFECGKHGRSHCGQRQETSKGIGFEMVKEKVGQHPVTRRPRTCQPIEDVAGVNDNLPVQLAERPNGFIGNEMLTVNQDSCVWHGTARPAGRQPQQKSTVTRPQFDDMHR